MRIMHYSYVSAAMQNYTKTSISRKNRDTWFIPDHMPRPAMLAVTCCFAPHLLSHAAPRHGRGHVIASRDHWRRVTHWPDHDRGIVYSRDAGKSRGAKRRCFPRFCSATNLDPFVESYVTRRRRSPSLLGEPVSVDRSIVEATSEIPSEFSNCQSFLCYKMKTFVHVALAAACLIASAHALPGEWHFLLYISSFLLFFFCKTRISRIR